MASCQSYARMCSTARELWLALGHPGHHGVEFDSSKLPGSAGRDVTATRLVLQSQLCPPLTALDVGLFGVCLMASTPGRPVQNVRGRGWRLPEQHEEQPAHLRHSERQELGCRAQDAAFFLCEVPFFWVCWAC